MKFHSEQSNQADETAQPTHPNRKLSSIENFPHEKKGRQPKIHMDIKGVVCFPVSGGSG
jgi:hypothetical protein